MHERPHRTLPRVMAALLLVLTGWTAANAGQDQTDAPAESPAQPAGGKPAELVPQVQLGLRVLHLRQQFAVRSTLVIVPDVSSYVTMITRWGLKERFPILIDDGSVGACENIGRFVRAFEPETVVRWSDGAGSSRTPDQDDLEQAIRLAWDVESAEDLRSLWLKSGYAPPGVVVMAENDPAWAGGLALAAWYAQPVIWVPQFRLGLGAVFKDEELIAFDQQVRDGLASTGLGYLQLGDELDAITLALDLPGRIHDHKHEKDAYQAISDRIGRLPDETRYAYASILHGNEQESVYRAMCSLFLQPRSAWLFSGYLPTVNPVEPAIDMLGQVGWRVTVDAPPNGTIDQWRARIEGGVEEELLHIQTAGHAYWFELRPGRAYGSDVPLLHRPAAVHFVHSFAAQRMNKSNSIGGRFMEVGAYAFIGSVHEPYLSAFHPPAEFFRRILGGMPWAAAGRRDGHRDFLWRVNIFGDPLFTVGAAAPRLDEPLELDGAIPLDDRMQAVLEERRFADAVADLIMLGRDEDALRIVRSVLADERVQLRPDLARTSLQLAARAADRDLFIDLYRMSGNDAMSDPLNQDLLWQMARPLLSQPKEHEQVVQLLRLHMREESVVEDAESLAPALRALYGQGAVEGMYNQLIEEADRNQVKSKLRRALRGQ